MKKNIICWFLAVGCVVSAAIISACKNECKDIQLMGAGDRIHDSYTFANNGVKLQDLGENNYEISGSVDYLSDTKVKEEFNISEGVNHVVAIKLSNCSNTVVKEDEVEIQINGVENYDAEHLNGSDYTFIILAAKVGATSTISVKWNKDAQAKVYTIHMSDDLVLKPTE